MSVTIRSFRMQHCFHLISSHGRHKALNKPRCYDIHNVFFETEIHENRQMEGQKQFCNIVPNSIPLGPKKWWMSDFYWYIPYCHSINRGGSKIKITFL